MNRKLKTTELNRVDTQKFKELEKHPIVVVLDDIRSLHNIGSVFRTADAFKIERIVICGLTAQPPHKEIHKTALGATESVSWTYYESVLEAVKELRSAGYMVAAAEQASKTVFLQNLQEVQPSKLAVVFGNEVFGVNQEVIDQSDFVLEIPQFGTKHSLNISVSVGIVLWEAIQKYIG